MPLKVRQAFSGSNVCACICINGCCYDINTMISSRSPMHPGLKLLYVDSTRCFFVLFFFGGGG